MTSRERVQAALAHKPSDRVPVDFGSTFVSGIHVSVVAALRDYYGLEKKLVKVIDPGQMLGEVEEDLKQILGVDTEAVIRRSTRYGFPAEDWKPWCMPDGLEVLVPGRFNVTRAPNGDILMHPGGDTSAPPSAVMPADGYFFDNIERQPEIDEDALDPRDNLSDFQPLAEEELQHLEASARRARSTGRMVVGSFGGTALGDISHIPGPALINPRGIRSVTEWYMSTRMRREYVHAVFDGQTTVGLANIQRIAERCGDSIDIVNLCGTDFGTQKSTFCSVDTFDELWAPYYKRMISWIHSNTAWRVFKHSCGAVEKLIPSLLDCGFDILNPVQCSAAGMDPEKLKDKYGRDIVFWGGGVDTQSVLPFGEPDQVREQVKRRVEIFSAGGGFVFNTVHNVQACTPIRNFAAMIEALR
jgi:hypothetical protein